MTPSLVLPRPSGRVSRVNGSEIEVRGLRLRLGDTLLIEAGTGKYAAEVVAVEDDHVRALFLGHPGAIGKGDRVSITDELRVMASPALLGRTIDAFGRPIDGGQAIDGEPIALSGRATPPLRRRRIDQPLQVGVRVIDTLCTVGRGQRIGIFGGSGVGKSTLLGMMARGTEASVNVVALIGERGREVREFIEDDLGPEGLARSVVVVATSDESPLVRLRAGRLAARLAEWFADRGSDVLFMFDSLTRLAMAQREIGLAAGEPPTARGYTPSVFALLPALLERSGPREHGTITGFFTVLVEGDDMNDPIADTARSILDGHLVLSRDLAVQGRYPAVDPLASLSRLAEKLIDGEQKDAATKVRAALAAAAEVRDLVEVGAYVPGTNPLADTGLAAAPALHRFFAQAVDDRSTYSHAWSRLIELVGKEFA